MTSGRRLCSNQRRPEGDVRVVRVGSTGRAHRKTEAVLPEESPARTPDPGEGLEKEVAL